MAIGEHNKKKNGELEKVKKEQILENNVNVQKQPLEIFNKKKLFLRILQYS